MVSSHCGPSSISTLPLISTSSNLNSPRGPGDTVPGTSYQALQISNLLGRTAVVGEESNYRMLLQHTTRKNETETEIVKPSRTESKKPQASLPPTHIRKERTERRVKFDRVYVVDTIGASGTFGSGDDGPPECHLRKSFLGMSTRDGWSTNVDHTTSFASRPAQNRVKSVRERHRWLKSVWLQKWRLRI
ncbi:hypothetical protein K440DRAFT_643259 [Wilcoxina mikolae CBS 423.85]|nr:hypothetical protein K440DRAFT_643259 [Wilcoxina mikolae CBS 423.85]